jgi:7-cyano-7-deazaguanine synthase
MANLATRVSVEGRLSFRILAPLLHMTKGQIIRKGLALGLDYSLTWSCYDPQRINDELLITHDRPEEETAYLSPAARHSFVPCGRCDSCLFRAKGFMEAGVLDPSGTLRIGEQES